MCQVACQFVYREVPAGVLTDSISLCVCICATPAVLLSHECVNTLVKIAGICFLAVWEARHLNSLSLGWRIWLSGVLSRV